MASIMNPSQYYDSGDSFHQVTFARNSRNDNDKNSNIDSLTPKKLKSTIIGSNLALNSELNREPSTNLNQNLNLNPISSSMNNNYPQKTAKAKLEIQGDIRDMSRNWTSEEWTKRRRLVKFKRTQVDSIIKVEFSPLDFSEYELGVPCVSCIYWDQKSECVITSVDAIYLLEQLVNCKFSIEEKNRIRRNLEGYHPLTVSKHKPSSEAFFKLIMSFPHPKPRNIEKDVKVYPWKTLGMALKKIISKCSTTFNSQTNVHYPITKSCFQNFSSHELNSPFPQNRNSTYIYSPQTPHHYASYSQYQFTSSPPLNLPPIMPRQATYYSQPPVPVLSPVPHVFHVHNSQSLQHFENMPQSPTVNSFKSNPPYIPALVSSSNPSNSFSVVPMYNC